ncbi:hypothetical protein [Streptomyces sp. NPDC054849]
MRNRSAVANWMTGMWFSAALLFGGAVTTAHELKHPVAFSRLIPVVTIPNPVSDALALAVMLTGGPTTIGLVQLIRLGPWWAIVPAASSACRFPSRSGRRGGT